MTRNILTGCFTKWTFCKNVIIKGLQLKFWLLLNFLHDKISANVIWYFVWLELIESIQNLITLKLDAMYLTQNKNRKAPSVFDDAFIKNFFNESQAANKPFDAYNIKEDKSAYTLELLIPGVEKNQIDIEIKNQKISVTYEKSSEIQQEEQSFKRKGFEFHSFKKSFEIPEGVNPAKINAELKNGILKVVLPKSEEQRFESKVVIK